MSAKKAKISYWRDILTKMEIFLSASMLAVVAGLVLLVFYMVFIGEG